MSTTWFITPCHPDEFYKLSHEKYIDPKSYEQHLKCLWEEVVLEQTDEYFRWEFIQDGQGIFFVQLWHFQWVAFPPDELALRYILVHRKFVPSNQQLFLFNSSSFGNPLELKLATTISEIAEFTGLY
jgi:hypothetical protein